jgi:hypothetical protein
VVIAAGVWAGLDDLVLVPGEDALYEVAVAVRGLRCEGELGKAAPVGPGFEHRPLHPGRDGPPVEDALRVSRREPGNAEACAFFDEPAG